MRIDHLSNFLWFHLLDYFFLLRAIRSHRNSKQAQALGTTWWAGALSWWGPRSQARLPGDLFQNVDGPQNKRHLLLGRNESHWWVDQHHTESSCWTRERLGSWDPSPHHLWSQSSWLYSCGGKLALSTRLLQKTTFRCWGKSNQAGNSLTRGQPLSAYQIGAAKWKS